jgi:hypothetical protein
MKKVTFWTDRAIEFGIACEICLCLMTAAMIGVVVVLWAIPDRQIGIPLMTSFGNICWVTGSLGILFGFAWGMADDRARLAIFESEHAAQS